MNLPNKISLVRIFLIPVFMFFYLAEFLHFGKLIAFIIFVLACSTDFIDGMIARRTNQVTNLGKFLDESADKLLTTSFLVMLLTETFINHIFLIIAVFSILARDQIVGLIRRLAVQKGKVIPAGVLGKIKTIVLDVALSMIMFVSVCKNMELFTTQIVNIFLVISLVFFSIGLVLNIVSGIEYAIKNKFAFSDLD